MCNSALPLTKLSSLTKAPLATVIVEPKTWELPTGLLTHCSPFFATALAVTHPVPKPQPIELPNVDYRAFELFVRWLYLGEITGPSWTASEPYVHAVVLGVKLECPIFKELAMIQLMDMHGHQAIDAATMDTLFTVSAEGSNLRLCAIDQFMFGAWNNNISDERDAWIECAESFSDCASMFMATFLDVKRENLQNPYDHGQKFLEVLKYKRLVSKHAEYCTPDTADDVKKQEMDTA